MTGQAWSPATSGRPGSADTPPNRAALAPRARSFGTRQGLRLAGDEYGPSSGATVLLLHGGGQTRHAWGGTTDALGREGWRAIALDLPGHGESEWSARGDYRIGTMAEALIDVWRQIGRPLAVVGASLGGLASMAAIGMAEGSPPDALVLVDITPRTEPAGVSRVIEFMRSHPDGFRTLEEAASHIASYRRRASSVRLDGLRKNLRHTKDGRWVWHWDPRLLDEPNHRTRLDPGFYERSLAGYDAPVLLVRGHESDVISEANVRDFMQLLPHASYVNLPDAGHMVAGDVNDVFTEAVVAFLREAMPAGSSPARSNEGGQQ